MISYLVSSKNKTIIYEDLNKIYMNVKLQRIDIKNFLQWFSLQRFSKLV